MQSPWIKSIVVGMFAIWSQTCCCQWPILGIPCPALGMQATGAHAEESCCSKCRESEDSSSLPPCNECPDCTSHDAVSSAPGIVIDFPINLGIDVALPLPPLPARSSRWVEQRLTRGDSIPRSMSLLRQHCALTV